MSRTAPRRSIPPSSRFSIARALVLTAGRAALERSLPVYLGVAIAAAVIFEGNGMKPATLTRMAQASVATRAWLWGAWLLVTMPAARAILFAPSILFLRALPIPRLWFLAVQGGLLAVAELPWAALWARGAGPAAGLAAALGAIAAHAFLVAPPRRAIEVLFAAVIAAAIAAGAPAPLLGAAGAATSGIALRGAWRRAPDRGGDRDRAIVLGPPPLALAAAHVATITRSHRALLLRAALFVAIAIALASFAARADGAGDAGALSVLSLTLFAPAIAAGAAGLAGPVLRSERDARWLLDVSGASPAVRVAGATLALAAAGAVYGAAHGAATGAIAGASWRAASRLAAEAAWIGAALAAASSCVLRRAFRGDGRDPARAVLAVLAIAVLAIAAIRALGAWSLALFPAAALASFIAAARADRAGAG